MGHSIKVAITDEAQRVALLAGEDAKAVQQYGIPPDQLGRVITALNASPSANGELHVLWGVSTYGSGRDEYEARSCDAWRLKVEPPLSRRPRDAADALDMIEAILMARHRREEEQKLAQLAALARADEAARTCPVDQLVYQRSFEGTWGFSGIRDLAEKLKINGLPSDIPGEWEAAKRAGREAEVQTRIDELNAKERAKRKDEEERKEAAKLAVEKERQEAEAAHVLYAMEVDELARAAAEGYDVNCAVVDHVVGRIRASMGDVPSVVLKEGSRAYGDAEWEERVAPRAYAFHVLDLANGACDIPVPLGISVDVEKIQRFTPGGDDTGDEPEPYTAVLVIVTSLLCKDRVIVFRAEDSK